MYSKEKYIEGFRKWLQVMNYAKSSVYYGPKKVEGFLSWLELNQVDHINEITGNKVKQFFVELGKRKSKRTGKVLSIATQRNYLTTVNRFARYIRQIEEGNIEVPIKFKSKVNKSIVVLSKIEVARLYNETDDSLLGIRDRAMLSVFYGCGARRNEASNLQNKDVLPDRNLLHIRKGKGGKERYVPMVGKVRTDILSYIQTARPMLLLRKGNESLFISNNGQTLSGEGLYVRFKKLLKSSGIAKKAGLHTLRHSIATHLLLNGMKLSEIAKFLGHSSLESTQIYTHLRDEI